MVKIFKLSVTSLLVMGFIFSAGAVPTVKKLGANGSVASTTTSAKNSASSSSSRLGSVRLNTTSTAKPVVKSVSTSASKDTNTNSANTNDARISLGKYLKSTNVVRQNAEQAAYEDAHMTANDMLILRDKVETAQNDLDDMKQDMQGHIENPDVHVTTGDKENWNAKQDALEAGEGVVIEKNEVGSTVISSVMKIPVGSETAPRTAPIWIE